MPSAAGYKRVVVKLSGEMLCEAGGGLSQAAIAAAIREIAAVVRAGTQVALVIGGGNFLRGRNLAGNPAIARPTADYMGMLATIMNGLALRDSFVAAGLRATVMSPISDPRICEPFVRGRALELMAAGEVVIFAGGTGSPFFTTDTCAALRASEIAADALIKATKVDGVFDADPEKNPKAKKFERVTYGEVLARRLGVMDLTAISLCMENRIPIIVLAMAKAGQLAAAAAGQTVGTLVTVD